MSVNGVIKCQPYLKQSIFGEKKSNLKNKSNLIWPFLYAYISLCFPNMMGVVRMILLSVTKLNQMK